MKLLTKPRSFPFIVVVSLLLFVSCDLFDSTFDKINNLFGSEEEKALTVVLDLQDEASIIVDELFASNMDTLSVIDSIYNYFSNNKDVEFVEADSQGVAVDYKNGISGGVFIGILQTPITFGSAGDSLLFDDENDAQLKSIQEDIAPTLKNSKTIYFDGAYTQFKETNDQVIAAANAGFAKIGMDAFDQYLDEKATIDVLSTLDQYGLMHITGHGWFRNYKNNEDKGFIENKTTYLLTGEKAEISKTFGKYYADILAKDIIIVSYKPDDDSDRRENRYWVSPKYVGDRNTFPEEEVFLYLGICNGGRGFWRNELGENNGISAVIAYDWSVYPHWEYKWAVKFYQKMCDTSKDFPMKIGECIKEIVLKEKKGYYKEWGIDENNKYWKVYVRMIPSGNIEFTFWQAMPIIDHFQIGFTEVEAKYTEYYGGEIPTGTRMLDHGVNFNDLNSTLKIEDNRYTASWEDIPILYTGNDDDVCSGSISFVLENDDPDYYPDGMMVNIANDVILHATKGTGERMYKYDFSMNDSEFTWSRSASYMSFNLVGVESCSNFYYENTDQDADGKYVYETTGENCKEHTMVTLHIVFERE
ncbi:MAG: hypothetical protein PF541_16885 [Prolixibacteraceae bacterium]|jgi:hypothetical protein|nr:hypothetical protein [Prolixibacteraceae bacterium]